MDVFKPFRVFHRGILCWRQVRAFMARADCFMTQTFLSTYLETQRSLEDRRLLRHGGKVHSQCDEDGIIAEIFRRIGVATKKFVEIGVGDGSENNSLWPLMQGWSGVWIDGSPEHGVRIEAKFQRLIGEGRLSFRNEFVTLDSIRRLEGEGVFADLDFLSLDVDGNDIHLLSEIKLLDARVLIVEYNAKFPPPHQFVMPYDPEHAWDGTDNFGASLTAWNQVLQGRGYCLVGCNVTGANAFFVRKDLVDDRFRAPFTPENHFEPARYWLAPGFVSGHRSNIA